MPSSLVRITTTTNRPNKPRRSASISEVPHTNTTTTTTVSDDTTTTSSVTNDTTNFHASSLSFADEDNDTTSITNNTCIDATTTTAEPYRNNSNNNNMSSNTNTTNFPLIQQQQTPTYNLLSPATSRLVRNMPLTPSSLQLPLRRQRPRAQSMVASTTTTTSSSSFNNNNISSNNNNNNTISTHHHQIQQQQLPTRPQQQLSRSSSLTHAPMVLKQNTFNTNNKINNRRASLVPMELRRGHSIGSHHPNHHHHQQQPHKTSTTTTTATTATSSSSSCDDGWTPLGLEYFVAPLTATCPEDEASVEALNRAARLYENAATTNNNNDDDTKLQHVQELLETHVTTTTTPFVAAARDSNLGVLLFRRGHTLAALEKLQSATSQLDNFVVHDKQQHYAGESIYLRLASLLNLSRALIRHNRIQACHDICKNQIATLVEEFTQYMKESTSNSSIVGSSTASRHYNNNNNNNYTNIPPEVRHQILWLGNVAKFYIMGMVHQRKGELEEALDLYTQFTTKARHDLGHSHVHVATLLYMKGSVLFEQRQLQPALLAQLAALRIHEKQTQAQAQQQAVIHTTTTTQTSTTTTTFQQPREVCRILYSIGRTLHDKEEYRDALHMYQRTVREQKIWYGPHSTVTVTTMCNIARVHHIMGDVEAARHENEAIVVLAKRLAGGRPHPFWANRLVVLGNIYVEVGEMKKAMEVFDRAVSIGGDVVLLMSCDRLDVDNRLATSLNKAGLQHPCAATA